VTERKPPEVPVHTWVDRLVREAEARGAFADLPGLGKPLPGIDDPLDEDWWVRQKLRAEELPTDALLPPALALRKELADLPERVRHLPDEAAVRATVREVNTRVAAYIRLPSGPVLPVAPADADAVVAGWHAARQGPPVAGTAPAAGGARPAPDGTGRTRWWRRRPRR